MGWDSLGARKEHGPFQDIENRKRERGSDSSIHDLGTAANWLDFTKIAQQARIRAGKTRRIIRVQPIDDRRA